MYFTENRCRHCFKPPIRRLGLFKKDDNFECYGESYVKCFWGLCDHQKSLEGFVRQKEGKVITKQPERQRTSLDLPYPSLVQMSLAVSNNDYTVQTKSKTC